MWTPLLINRIEVEAVVVVHYIRWATRPTRTNPKKQKQKDQVKNTLPNCAY